MIDSIASRKSQAACAHVGDAKTFEDIVPNPVIHMDNLKYTRETLNFLHKISYSRVYINPMSLFRDLVCYMEVSQRKPTHGSNLYICMFIYFLVKACKKSMTVNLLLGEAIITEGICFGPKNKYNKTIMDQYTIKVCPWRYKPVNLVVKKKSAPGGSHKSQVFSDDYTCEPLYCVERNNRGILSFPLITKDREGTIYSNAFEWEINSGFTRVLVIEQNFQSAKLNIYNKATRELLFTPVETYPTCKPDDVYKCLLCRKTKTTTILRQCYLVCLIAYPFSSICLDKVLMYSSCCCVSLSSKVAISSSYLAFANYISFCISFTARVLCCCSLANSLKQISVVCSKSLSNLRFIS